MYLRMTACVFAAVQSMGRQRPTSIAVAVGAGFTLWIATAVNFIWRNYCFGSATFFMRFDRPGGLRKKRFGLRNFKFAIAGMSL